MDRRARLATLTGQWPEARSERISAAAPPSAIFAVTTSLAPYDGPWGIEQAAHLLRRTSFGPPYRLFKEAVEKGLEATVNELFSDRPQPDPPINYYFENDPNVPVGATWIDAPYSLSTNLRTYRFNSLRGWTILQMMEEGISIREKLTLFWHNHFAINNINDPRYLYKYIALMRVNAWGNFRELAKAVTIDPAMLRFLNGNQNTRNAPNENYARELLELFTIGKGDLAGPGDYTNYTEEDIREMARVLTGWRDQGFNTINADLKVDSFFRPFQHDTGIKRLSFRFDETEIGNMGDQEYVHLIDIIFQKEEVARHICRKLYRWFVYYVITDEAETNIIEPMAQILIDNDYVIRPALEALLRSQHFFDILYVGPMIKNPFDYTLSLLRQTETPLPGNINQKYALFQRIFGLIGTMEMEYYNIPEVAGWKAYYQEPQYYRTWINATTLQNRLGFASRMANEGYFIGGSRFRIDPLIFIGQIDNALDPDAVIRGFSSILFPQPLSETQLQALKEVLLPGLPDYEWTLEYGEYLANPGNADLADAIEAKLRDLISVLVNLAEFHLS